MWATRRRTIILLIILGAIALFIVLPYWLIHRVPPTCSDGKMNQDERGIDPLDEGLSSAHRGL